MPKYNITFEYELRYPIEPYFCISCPLSFQDDYDEWCCILMTRDDEECPIKKVEEIKSEYEAPDDCKKCVCYPPSYKCGECSKWAADEENY